MRSVGIGEQAVAVEALDVVALERAAVAPDVDVVFLHGDDEHRAGDGAADRRGVEVGDAGRRDVERAALQRREAFGHELARGSRSGARFSAPYCSARARESPRSRARRADRGWRCTRTGSAPFCAHPVQRRARVEAAGERDADALADGNLLKDVQHREVIIIPSTLFSSGLWGGSFQSRKISHPPQRLDWPAHVPGESPGLGTRLAPPFFRVMVPSPEVWRATRLRFLDVARGASMFLVLLSHFASVYFRAPEQQEWRMALVHMGADSHVSHPQRRDDWAPCTSEPFRFPACANQARRSRPVSRCSIGHILLTASMSGVEDTVLVSEALTRSAFPCCSVRSSCRASADARGWP